MSAQPKVRRFGRGSGRCASLTTSVCRQATNGSCGRVGSCAGNGGSRFYLAATRIFARGRPFSSLILKR